MAGLADALAAAAGNPFTFDRDGVGRLAAASVDVSYPADALDVLAAHSGASWWNEQRVRWATRSLRDRSVAALLDVGAGNGAMAVRLRDVGVDVVALEPLADGCRRAARAGVPAVCGTFADLDLRAGSVPAIAYFDVFEHLADPVTELRAAHRALEPGGWLLATVPAYPWLWGPDDEIAGHRRRYTARSLRRECCAAGFRADRVEHLFASLVLPAATVRLRARRPASGDEVLDRLSAQLDPPRPVAAAADAVMRAEHALARRVRLPFGLTVAGVFRRP